MKRIAFWAAVGVAGFGIGWTAGGHFDFITLAGAVAAAAAWRLNRKEAS